MEVCEKAKEFAIKAHYGQVRKNEVDKPMIMHPISVANILRDYKCDDNLVASGYLHDVIEDTNYTFQDIDNIFGSDISSLVLSASESDKSLSWEERKKETIDKTKSLPLRNKLLICADKINNLEDLKNKFERTGLRDFSLFRRGEESQKWYYNAVYDSLIYNEDRNNPLFLRLKNDIDCVFDKKENNFLSHTIFGEDEEYYEKLKILHAQKDELKRLRDLCGFDKPFIVEFCGTPRTGKTTNIDNINDFFKKGGFKSTIVDEFTTSEYYKKVFFPEIKDGTLYEINMDILEEIINQLIIESKRGNDIVLIDRSVCDRMVWNRRLYDKNGMTQREYDDSVKKAISIARKYIDLLVIGYTTPTISLKRDYLNSLALEERRFLNLENIKEYNDALDGLDKEFENGPKSVVKVDTTQTPIRESSITIANEIMPLMKKRYISLFNKTTNGK